MVDKSPIGGCRTTKIYCRPDCPAGRRMKPENKVHFHSIDEARAKGYRACKICKPDDPLETGETLYLSSYPSPLGTYILVSSKAGIVCVKPEDRAQRYFDRWRRERVELRDNGEYDRELKKQLKAYFAGTLREFTIPLDLRGTAFQRQVWNLLCDIPWGETRSYGHVAEALGRPKAARAVGRAVGTNPVAIVVPCHRVLGADGSLTGYGGGLDRKVALLELEGSGMAQGAFDI